ncbi:MAG: type III polyketide synthase [Balneolaceae bacterium]
MPVYIQAIETAVPEYAYRQDDLREQMKELLGNTEVQKRIIHRLYAKSGIQTRHSILGDFQQNTPQQLYFNGHGASPGTGFRNKIYEEKGRRLFINTARNLIENHEGSAGEITHLITVSCTGFYAPGPDYDIIKALQLSTTIERYHLGFMGCYAAISALKMASQICQAQPDSKVMIVATELCSLHFQSSSKTDDLISSSVFADGSAGAIVSSQNPESENCFQINRFASAITDEGEKDMAWTIGDTGFNMVLSSYIPDIISRNLNDFLDPVMKQHGLTLDQIQRWAVHPGGRAILDRVEQQLELPEETLKASRFILSNYGNMSSVTILFVLNEILKDPSGPDAENVLSLAFGPGLTIESGFFTKLKK